MWDALVEIFAAEGYAKAAGRVGVCIATFGPGDTNLVTGLADGMMDSIPLVAITGQVPRRMIGTDAFQATPIVEVTHAITKHNYLVLGIKDLPRVIKEAFYLTRSSRPGPVLVDVPKDIQQQLAVPDWDSPMSITARSIGTAGPGPNKPVKPVRAGVRNAAAAARGAGPAKPAPQQPKPFPAASSAPRGPRSASKLAQFLFDPPPPGPGGKPQRGAKPDPAAKALHQPAYPLAPHLAAQGQHKAAAGSSGNGSGGGGAAAAAGPFRFDTPSPDDAAQERRPGAAPAHSASAPPAPSLPQNKAFLRPSPMMQQQRQQTGGSGGGGGGGAAADDDAAAGGVAGLSLGGTSHGPAAADEGEALGHPAAGTRHHHAHGGPDDQAAAAAAPERPHGLHTRRLVSEYAMEPELAREVAAAAAAESASLSSPPSTSSAAPKSPLHLVVLGHVDAGKSSLMGRLLHELGRVSEREAHKHQRDAAAAGKVRKTLKPSLPARRSHTVFQNGGATHGAAGLGAGTLGERQSAVALIWVLVPNMIAGAAQADAALLLVDGSPGGFEAGFSEGSGGLHGTPGGQTREHAALARSLGIEQLAVVADAALLLVDGSPGGFEAGFSEGSGGLHGTPGGQTREHAALARSLGIEQLAVVVSKLDTVGYAQERFEHIRAALLPFLRSVGFRESGLQWLPASGPLGENLVRPPADPALAAWWRDGPTVVGAIDAFAPRERAVGRPLRMPVSDVFKSRSGAVVLGGKLEGGTLRPGSKVALVPAAAAGQLFAVRSIEVAGAPAHLARAGDSCEVALVAAHGGGGGAAMEPGAVAAGAVLCHPDFPAVLVMRFELRVVMLDVSVPLLRGQAVTLHAHVAREEGHITALSAVLDPRSGEVTKVDVGRGGVGWKAFSLEKPWRSWGEVAGVKGLGGRGHGAGAWAATGATGHTRP
ncbi:hypothetical protein GPECTOR_20g453 [Gonium pectorale]|uniref:Tr-type G domain-containing protein n=1 Tax=Gonium pectorale TaxID=33097 RepID=A0A150GIF7_GONPE|nr:hypothetical protein GPECTOR_20g453 [Gonium pectorale]|eukprot:KXZ49597.1 hypothetical protein GPECTOR_20g453 [Gonium pectorale]